MAATYGSSQSAHEVAMFCALALVAVFGLAQPNPEALLGEIQKAYQQGGDFSASFTHVYINKLRGKKKVESGRLWAKRDGRVRWSYQKPSHKDFIYDGKTAYFYEPDKAQVSIYEGFQKSPLWNAMRFLWGQGSLSESFDVRSCDASCGEAEAGDVLIKLVPKEPLAAVDHVVLVIDPKAKRVRRSLVFDALGNRTEYQFSDVKLGITVKPEKFDFTIPDGVNRVRATGEGAR